MSWTATLVTDDASARAWLGVPEALFAGQPGWRPRVEATAAVFDPARNPCFEDGVAARWVLRDAGGALAGRVAAFGRGPGPDAVGGIGFFACVDALEAASTLLRAAEAWLQEQGFPGADAPINFGERDRFWGLRVHGSGPALGLEAWDPPHHRGLLEALGYRPRMESHTYRAPLAPVPFAWLKQGADLAAARGVQCERLVEVEPLARTFSALYSAIFPASGRVRPLTQGDVEALLRATPARVRPQAWVARADGAPIGILVFAPEPSSELDGRFRLTVSNVLAVAAGQRSQGLGAAMSYAWLSTALEEGYEEFALAGVGSHSEVMVQFATAGAGPPAYVHWTYRRWFDGRRVEPQGALGSWGA